MMQRIMINGRACSGKDAVADYLVDKYGFTKVTFATPIYDIAREYFGMRTKDRLLLQEVGQKLREVRQSVWVDYAYEQAMKLDKAIVPDVRQANEYIKGQELGFIPINVYADLDIRIKRCRKRDGIEPDISLWEAECETGADNFEYIKIENNGTLEELYSKLDKLISSIN